MERKEEVKFGGAATSLPADLSCLQGGGAEALATLEKQLICPICLEMFNKPVVILPCQHNLCRKCANELYQPSLFQARTTMMVNSGRFRCPSCRHEVVLDRHGVYGLQRNLLVENIIDVYKQEVNNSSVTSPVPPPAPPAQVTCPDHEGEKVNIYCLTCQVSTCSLCKVFGAHQSCQVAPLTDVYQQQKDVLSEGVSSLVTVNDKVQALIDELEQTCRNIEENSKTQKQSVCDKFNRVFSILEERRKAMTQRISSEQEEKTGHAQALVRCYGDSVAANNKLMERAASSMEEPDMAAFVQNSRELITKVIAATGSCPAETLTPGYENMSHYRFNFSRQERALRSIDFLKVVEDVPEEPEVEQVPEEPKESSAQNIEPNHQQEPSTQNLESVVEPVKELIPTLTSPPVEPAQAAAATSSPVPPAPGRVRDSVDPAVAVRQPETSDLDLNDGGSGLTRSNKEEGGCAAPDPVKEGNTCEQQEGMSTQQCEGEEAEGDAGDWTTQSETEDKRDPQDEEEEMQMKEATDTDRAAGGSLSEARIQTEAPDAVRASVWSLDSQTQEQSTPHPNQPPPELQQLPLPTELHTSDLPLPRLPQESENQSQPLSPLHESQSQLQKAPVELGSVFIPVPRLRLTKQETAGAAGITEEEDEEEEMQGWVCLPGVVDKHFSPVEGSFDLGDGSLDGFSDSNDSPPSISPEETRSGLERGSSGMEKVNFELSGGKVEDAGEKRQHDEEDLDLKCVSELKERALGEGASEAEAPGNDLSASETDAVSMREDSSEADAGDDGVESSSNSSIPGGGDAEFDVGGSGFAEEKEDDGENSEQPEDLNAKMETSVAETEEKITSSVSLQAVTLLFYLLAFLVILQRVWAYIGFFICT